MISSVAMAGSIYRCGLIGAARWATVEGMTEQARGHGATATATSVVTAFLDALGRLDVDAAVAMLAEDVLYQNVSLPPARGKAAVARQLGLLSRYCTRFEAINHKIASAGETVLTERTDIIEAGRFRGEFWVFGSFEVRDGKITLWRDYFDWANLLAGFAKGTGRALADLVRRRK
jgi:limonene-1,2-epoxide hydrolase